jgi:hypothetical protein
MFGLDPFKPLAVPLAKKLCPLAGDDLADENLGKP